jgi:hypothetical protein
MYFLYFKNMNVQNKLKCLSLALFTGKATAYPSEESFRCSTLGKAPGLTHKHYTRL